MVYYPNMSMDICTYTDTVEMDAYGNPVKGYVYRETVPGDFQPSSRNDRLTEAGELLQDTYRLYLDVNVDVDPTDIFRDPEGNTYTIIGTPISLAKTLSDLLISEISCCLLTLAFPASISCK